MSNSVGEAWRPYFSKALSWYVPSQVTGEYLVRFAQTDWIQKMLRAARLNSAVSIRILEAGCGTAFYAICLALLGFSIDAFDYNETALVFAREIETQARRIKPALQVQLAVGDLLSIPTAPNAYDLVFNQAVLDYFCDDNERQRALAEMVRVTKPGGWVALIVQHTGHPFRSAWERMGWRGYDNQPPTTIQTPARLERELRAAGLENVSIDGLYPWKAFFFYPAWHRRWRVAENTLYLLGEFLRRYVPLPRTVRAKLGLQFIAMGQKP